MSNRIKEFRLIEYIECPLQLGGYYFEDYV